ncbi:hypothetical protein B7P43_G17197 [Cryptotermes secundus]|uniref:Reverse transcriptase domain-containing protein n=1 Tax=Cryptotermes secundus TaxID=105785 RepID=A0A2J7Q583_9NEOP|nr:hypothetical protein B7P43_G17197 [Cryptotermes secundus]
MSADQNQNIASQKLQQHLISLKNWMEQWKIKVNPAKSSQITFTRRRAVCPQVSINNIPIAIKQEVKHLGLHLYEELTRRMHIIAKRRHLELKTRNMNWLINKKSELSLENKIIIYKTILKPVWTYGIELWGCSKPSNTKILQTFQSKTLRNLVNAPFYVSNATLHNDLGIPYVTEVIRTYADHSKQQPSNKKPLQPTSNRKKTKQNVARGSH